MSQLYTINGNYPNQNFAFTLTPENMSMAKSNGHSHSISDVDGLESALSAKADIDHSHICVEQLYSTTKLNSAHKINLTVDSQVNPNSSIVVEQNKITLSCVSLKKDNVQQIKNKNNNNNTQQEVILITTEPSANTVSNKFGILRFKENIYV